MILVYMAFSPTDVNLIRCKKVQGKRVYFGPLTQKAQRSSCSYLPGIETCTVLSCTWEECTRKYAVESLYYT